MKQFEHTSGKSSIFKPNTRQCFTASPIHELVGKKRFFSHLATTRQKQVEVCPTETISKAIQ